MTILSINNLHKRWQELVVFESFNVSISESRTCILGENGLGKTTLLAIIAGLEDYQKGQISLHGEALISPINSVAMASDAMLIPPFISAKDALELQCESFDLAWPAQLIKHLYFEEHIFKLVSSLSAGNLKKLHLITAFMRTPRLLLLDEPNIAIDPKSLCALWELIANFENDIIVASNEPEVFKAQGFTTRHLFDLST